MLYSKSDTLEIISHLPKYLRDSKTGDIFSLTMIKNDWDATFKNSYIVRYAKENTKSISTVNIKIEAIGRHFDEAVYNMYLQVADLQKRGIVKGKTWINIIQVENEADIPKKQNIEEPKYECELSKLFDGGTLFEEKVVAGKTECI